MRLGRSDPELLLLFGSDIAQCLLMLLTLVCLACLCLLALVCLACLCLLGLVCLVFFLIWMHPSHIFSLFGYMLKRSKPLTPTSFRLSETIKTANSR